MFKRLAVIFAALLLACSTSSAQKLKGEMMYYEVMPDGDTMFFDSIDPVWCFPRGRRM